MLSLWHWGMLGLESMGSNCSVGAVLCCVVLLSRACVTLFRMPALYTYPEHKLDTLTTTEQHASVQTRRGAVPGGTGAAA